MGSVPVLGRFPGKGNAIHLSILAWRILWIEEPGRPHSPWGCKKLDMTGQLTQQQVKKKSLFFSTLLNQVKLIFLLHQLRKKHYHRDDLFLKGISKLHLTLCTPSLSKLELIDNLHIKETTTVEKCTVRKDNNCSCTISWFC